MDPLHATIEELAALVGAQLGLDHDQPLTNRRHTYAAVRRRGRRGCIGSWSPPSGQPDTLFSTVKLLARVRVGSNALAVALVTVAGSASAIAILLFRLRLVRLLNETELVAGINALRRCRRSAKSHASHEDQQRRHGRNETSALLHRAFLSAGDDSRRMARTSDFVQKFWASLQSNLGQASGGG
jgi:hypothetical protein